MNTTGLTDYEIRVRIAIATGCKCYRRPFDGKVFLCKEEPSGDWSTTDRYPHRLNSDIPDYLNDLNAMHEAEKRLTPPQWSEYAASLEVITRRDPSERLFEIWRTLNPSRVIDVCLIQATARQRAMAFLAMLPEPEAGR